MKIRRATPEDAASVRKIAEASWRAAYGEFLQKETIDSAMKTWYAVDSIARSLERSDSHTFVAVVTTSSGEPDAEAGEVMIGFASGVPQTDDDAVISRIYVDPKRWGDGVGTVLLDRLTDALRTDGFDRLSLWVLEENEIGRAFYKTHGFERRAERESDLFGERVTEFELVTEL